MRKQTSRLNYLLKYYVRTSIVLVLCLPLVMTLFYFLSQQTYAKQEIVQQNQRVAETLKSLVSNNKRMTYNLTMTPAKLETLRKYFSQTYSEYATDYLLGKTKEYFPNDIYRLYDQELGLMAVQVHLDSYPDQYISTIHNKYGKKSKEMNIIEGIKFSEPIYHQTHTNQIGTISYYYQPDILIQTDNQLVQTALIDAKSNQVIFSQSGPIEVDSIWDHQLPWHYSESLSISGLPMILSYIPIRGIIINALKIALPVFLVSLSAVGMLYYLQRKLFGNYTAQVNDIVRTSQKISQGNNDVRIDLTDKQDELLKLSQEINDMLNKQQKNIRDIYELQIKQRESQLKALRSQVNPHFLYNTLEFIRMSVLVEGDEGLADIIYDFSALMRNRIEHTDETTLDTELEFCHKYLALYQARFPDKLTVEWDLNHDMEVVVPKFCLQPLVENYIVHGVNFSQCQNKIRITSTLNNRGDAIEIMIQDNGKGMTVDAIEQLNHRLLLNVENYDSLGVEIVHDQMKYYFGELFEMEYRNNEWGGVTVWMTIPINQ